MSARIFIFPTFDRGWADAAEAAVDHRPDLYTLLAANDATADESECVEDMAPGATVVALATMWAAENRFAIAVGIWAGCLLTVALAWIVSRFL